MIKGFFFIDISEMKQNSKYEGKKIFAPLILKEENIKCVVVSVPRFFATVKSNVDSIKKCDVYNIIELINK